jgi:hypothetical protein
MFIYEDRDKDKILQTGVMDILQKEENRINQVDPESVDMLIEGDVDFDDI